MLKCKGNNMIQNVNDIRELNHKLNYNIRCLQAIEAGQPIPKYRRMGLRGVARSTATVLDDNAKRTKPELARFTDGYNPRKRKSGFKSPKLVKWTPEAIEVLLEAVKTKTIEELVHNNLNAGVSSIRSRLSKLGYKMDRKTRLYVKK